MEEVEVEEEEEEGDKVEVQVEVEEEVVEIVVEGNDSVRTNQDNHLPLPPVRTVARIATPATATRDDNDHDLHLVVAVIDNDSNTSSINRCDIMIHSRRRSSRRH